MLKRRLYDRLLEWKAGNGQSALLVEGARRVGKSTLVEDFARREYAASAIIDFSMADDAVKALFTEQRNDLDRFFFYLETFLEKKFVPRDTVIIFDEVQFFPQARAFIKQLVQDGRYDYLETGSLISIRRNVKDILIPSEEDSVRLNPLNFEEFLWAIGKTGHASALREAFETTTPLPEVIHRELMRHFREYILVGGMPQSVNAFIDNQSLEQVDTVKRRILKLYREDIAKYADGEDGRIMGVLEELPSQLSKHEKRFTLTAVNKNARMREYKEAFFWLSEAFIVNNCLGVTDPQLGLSLNANHSALKCYFADTGLLLTHVFASQNNTPSRVYKDFLSGMIDMNEGMLTENVVAQQLVASGRKLYFYSNTNKKDAKERMEVDFLVIREYEDAAMKARVSPIEVKSTNRYGTKSLDKFKKKFGKRVGTQYILHPKPLKRQNEKVYLPLYMAHLL